MVVGGGGQHFDIFSDQWEILGHLGGAPGSLEDNFKHDVGFYFEVSFTLFWSIQDRSGSNLGPSWTTVGHISLSKTPPS